MVLPNWVIREVMAPVLGQLFSVNITFARQSPYATPFIYIQGDRNAEWFCIADRAWQVLLFFNLKSQDCYTQSRIKSFFPSYRTVSLQDPRIQGESIALEFAAQLCLTGIDTNLPVDVIIKHNLEFAPMEPPKSPARHLLQQYGFNLVNTPLIHLRELVGDFFGQFFNSTNHIDFPLELQKRFGTLKKTTLRKKLGTNFTPEMRKVLKRFKQFAELTRQMYFEEEILFSVIVPRPLRLDRRNAGATLIAQLQLPELANLIRLISFKNPSKNLE